MYKKIFALFLLFFFITNSFADPLNDNLLYYYKMDETSGATATDATSTNNFSASGGYTNGNSGIINNSWYLDGTNGKLANSSSSNNNPAAFTYSTWVKINNNPASGKAMRIGYAIQNINTDGWMLEYQNSSGTLRLLFRTWAAEDNIIYNVDLDNAQWNHIVISLGSAGKSLWVNGTEVDTSVITSYTSGTTPLTIGELGTNKVAPDSYFDEISFFNSQLSDANILYLYNSGAGKTYPFIFPGVDANFDYEIDKTNTQVKFTDTSTTTGAVSITDWNWIINNVPLSTSQDYNYSTSQLTDINACLIVDTNASLTDTKCVQFNTGDWTAPTTTLTDNGQISGLTDYNLVLTCSDNNSGCEYINFSIDGGDYNYYLIGDNPLNIIVNGTGEHTINYFSSDASDNNESINTYNFTTYGVGKFTIYDENSKSLLNDVTYTISPSINGNSGATLTDTNTFDLNLQGITNTTYTFTFTKTGYGTRYYVFDANKFIESDLDINFALLPSSLTTSVPMKVYQTDETTIFSNTFVELYLPSKNNWIVGRQKTNASGEATYNLHLEDQNYYANVDGIYTYRPVALTILYPKNEITLDQITENWKIDITQNLYQSYTDLNTDKVIYLLPNTANPFNIKIGDMNGNYFSRTYAQQYPGNPLTDTLQPYLMPSDEGLLTTINVVNKDNIKLPEVTIKIYKYISGLGRTLVEQVITDSKGQALVLLEINDDYEFETYYNGEFVKTYNITATSSTIYMVVDVTTTTVDGTITPILTNFTPVSTGLTKQLIGTQAFAAKISNPGEVSYDANFIITQNGIVLDSTSFSSTSTSYTSTLTINWVDLNQGTVTSQIIINTDSNTYNYSQNYFVNDSFGTNYDILNGIREGVRQDFGCSTTGICMPTMVIGIIISIVIVLFASVKVSGIGSHGSSAMFAIMMIFFNYLNWIPIGVTIAIVLIISAFIINERRT